MVCQNDLDKTLVEEFKAGVSCENLHSLFSKYGVIRTIPLNVPRRLERFVDMLKKYEDKQINRQEFPGIVEKELEDLRKIYGKGPLSAITKAFFMTKPQHSSAIAIYDGNTWEGLHRRGLEPGYNGYSAYHKAWFIFFDDPATEKGLKDALAWLPESPAAKRLLAERGEAVAAEINTLAAGPLMRNRVTDMRLFYEGGGYLEKPIECAD